MGNQGDKAVAKSEAKSISLRQSKIVFTHKLDYALLFNQTGLTKEQIDEIFGLFKKNNGVLEKREFIKLYISLRPETTEHIKEIAEFIFNAFDSDYNGSISLKEFMVILFLNFLKFYHL